MRIWMAAALMVAGAATNGAAQDRAGLCVTARAQLEENMATYWVLMDHRLAAVAQARAHARSMPEEQRQAVTDATQVMMALFSEDHQGVHRRFQNSQYALARTIYLLCGDDWPEGAAIPPENSEVYDVE